MRPPFSDLDRVKKAARRNVEDGTATLRRWWSKKYSLPPNHELFTSQTLAELNQEMMEDLMIQKKDIERELQDGDPDEHRPKSRSEILLEQLADINRALDEADDTITQDDLTAYWDEQLDRGEEPDLDMTVEDLKRLRREEKYGWRDKN